ncbi:uncharacterized protein AB675_9082 [Cyphellophora attinorum]|uniref:Uncharacterized protein n=1 Tax=Cyphellophora attinorum TaxID=1664694 RepID=A0A0N0NNP0_9EURO|nr:uncharacterized protein AB675_9082 [Phialophora attinorum]KPI41768.1 hypothetical protein AB675_9082 [Phialophora attinorum]
MKALSLSKLLWTGLALFALLLWLASNVVVVADLRQPLRDVYPTMFLMRQGFSHIPASNPAYKFGSHWQHALDGRRSTSASDTYVEVTVANTSCVYLEVSLYCRRNGPSSPPAPNARHVSSMRDHGCDSDVLQSGARLRVKIQDRTEREYHVTHGKTVKLACGLAQDQAHHIRIRALLPSDPSKGVRLKFDGLWLNREGYLVRALAAGQPYIEVASATNLSIPSSYPSLLASRLNMSHVGIDTRNKCLSAHSEGGCSDLRSHHFGSRNTCTPLGFFSHRFDVEAPSAHILELGESDALHILRPGVTEDQVGQAVDALVKQYRAFIHSIRATAHEYASGHGIAMNVIETSYAYNSDSMATPILLLVPFTRSRQARQLLRSIVSRTAQEARTDGDLYVVWADTERWVTKDDMLRGNDSAAGQLSDHAHTKIAFGLSEILCPLMPVVAGCHYHVPRKYDGELHLPDAAGMGRLLEERKLALIKERLGIFGAS